jgi:hypothetical protein
MNNTPTTARQSLDAFDDALVSELRAVVLARSAAPARRRRRRPTLAVGSVAAVAAAAFGISTLGTSAAFAVERTPTGTIQISIHRLDDAAGLEKALASYGIDAKVDYQPTKTVDLPRGIDAPRQVDGGNVPGVSGTVSGSSQSISGESSLGGTSASAGGVTNSSACGAPNRPPMTADLQADDYVITIPRGSVLTRADSELKITTTGNVADSLAGLSVDYTVGGTTCGFGSLSVTAPAS